MLIFYFFLFTKYPYGIPKREGQFCLQDYGYYIKPNIGSMLLLHSKKVRHGILVNSEFFQISILTKESISHSFERITQELHENRRVKEKKSL